MVLVKTDAETVLICHSQNLGNSRLPTKPYKSAILITPDLDSSCFISVVAIGMSNLFTAITFCLCKIMLKNVTKKSIRFDLELDNWPLSYLV